MRTARDRGQILQLRSWVHCLSGCTPLTLGLTIAGCLRTVGTKTGQIETGGLTLKKFHI